MQRFWDRVVKTDGCWLWTGSLNGSGYGTIYYQGKVIGTHRLSYILKHGRVPDGMDVCHTCDVRNCVRPEHLWIGSRSDNLIDMTQKGRRVNRDSGPQDGEHNLNAKLNWDLVRWIRFLWAEGKSQIEIQKITGVPRQNVYNVVHYKSWME